jgi:hypothetical protein
MRTSGEIDREFIREPLCVGQIETKPVRGFQALIRPNRQKRPSTSPARFIGKGSSPRAARAVRSS